MRRFPAGRAEPELSNNVVADRGGGAAGESNGLRLTEQIPGAPKCPIAWAEVMPPFTDAMRLIDGEEDWTPGGLSQLHCGPFEPFGRQIQEPERAFLQGVQHRRLPFRAECAVQRGCGKTAAACRGDLILHEGDEG